MNDIDYNLSAFLNTIVEQLYKETSIDEIYSKCTCKECNQKFKYRVDSFEANFATCPSCGCMNNFEDYLKSLGDLGENVNLDNDEKVVTLDRLKEVRASRFLRSAAIESARNWKKDKESMLSKGFKPFTVTCDDNWSVIKDRDLKQDGSTW